MEKLVQTLERAFAAWNQFLARLAEHSRQHANRRTIIIVILGGVIFALVYLYIVRPPNNFPSDQLVSVPQGSSVAQTASLLYENDVIRSPIAFRIVVDLLGRQLDLQAGDYIFKEPLSVISIAKAIAYGQFGLEPTRIRIPEGATVAQMATIYSEALPRFNESQFLQQAQPLQGYLFPDTYFFLPNATAQIVIETMQQDFNTQIATIQPDIASSTHSLQDIVIMASIVEKEAQDTQDRRLIAGVLWRRLANGMPLQVDSTLLYVYNDKSDFQLTVTDLASTTPYNTYTHTGLPPGPIDSPSLDSLEAAADPIDDGYLYYLADANGVTHYCKTFVCQQYNERKYLDE